MTVKIRLLGIFRRIYGAETITIHLKEPRRISEIIDLIVDSSPQLRRVLIDPELKSPTPNALILINGREISALKGLGSIVHDRDEIVLIPVTHGG